jgi:hypothetical protein
LLEFRERRIAQIVRDFMEAYELSNEIGERLHAGDLRFTSVERLVGEGEESTLYRLKEQCHALFRLSGARSRTELQAEQLFDLAVGALFHEAMRFRESFYLTTTYGPRLEEIMGDDTASAPLVAAFRRMFEAGRRRMVEAQAEMQDLLRETRDKLLTLVRQMPASGAVARSLVENPELTTEVLGVPLDQLLADVYGSDGEGYRLAVENLVGGGHYIEAAQLLDSGESGSAWQMASQFAHGMAAYYAGDPAGAVDWLGTWVEDGAVGAAEWRDQACRVLRNIADTNGAEGAPATTRAEELLAALNQPQE